MDITYIKHQYNDKIYMQESVEIYVPSYYLFMKPRTNSLKHTELRRHIKKAMLLSNMFNIIVKPRLTSWGKEKDIVNRGTWYLSGVQLTSIYTLSFLTGQRL